MMNNGCMAMTLKPKTNHPNGSVSTAKTEESTSSSVICEGFSPLFSSFAMARSYKVYNVEVLCGVYAQI